MGSVSQASKQVLIVGNPNVGKTTLFNDLTGASEKVANYGGITTKVVSGIFFDNLGCKHAVYDCPGTYGLSAYAPEEKDLCELLFHADQNTRILYVMDAEHLEHNLFLGTQLLELGLSICFAITLSRKAEKNGRRIHVQVLEQHLEVPVVLLENHSHKRKRQLRDLITRDCFRKSEGFHVELPSSVEFVATELSKQTGLSPIGCLFLLLQESRQRVSITRERERLFSKKCAMLNETIPYWKTQCITLRYKRVEAILSHVTEHVSVAPKRFHWDNLLMHKVWGPFCMGIVFFLLLMSVFVLAEYPMRLCEQGVQHLQALLGKLLPPSFLKGLLIEGVIGGVGNVLVFLPQFILMIACMSFLENTGYLARVTFLLDRWMKKIGLSGPSFVALFSCYACTIPGIMQTRCLHNREERLTTLFVAPWVNCSSRAPIYLLLVGLLFPNASAFTKTLILIFIYTIGFIAALILAALIRKFFLKTRYSIHLAEMPPLLRPQFSYIFKLIKEQTFIFLKKAGTYILCFSVALWICLHTRIKTQQSEQDCVRWMGDKLEYVLKPIGFDWHIGIGLLSAFGTRENFISTLAVLHQVDTKRPDWPLRVQLQEARDNHGQLIYSPATCISLILFFMFSLQCIGTFVFIKHETYSWRLTLLQFIFMNAVAYVLCLLTYQTLKYFL